MHLYDRTHGVFGTNGIVAAGIPHAVGAAMSARIRGTDGVAVAFFGDGAINHGAFHESVNFAGAQKAAVVFVCENNLYATATPFRMATRNTDVASKAAAYGIPGVAVNGNDITEVWATAGEAVARARRGEGPTLIEARTYRTVGHHEGEPLTGTYRTQEELDAWKSKCPILLLQDRLKNTHGISESDLGIIEAEVEDIVADALKFARQSPFPEESTVFSNVWSDDPPPEPPPAIGPIVTQGWLDAVRDGVAEEMRRDPHILYFGEGTGERGGSFAHTKGLWAEFGGHRMVDTPISELGFTGAAIGASATGCRTVADLMFMDFLFETGGQIPLQASKLRYMSNGQMSCPVVLRTPSGAIKSAGPHHSGSYHAIWAHFPGLTVVMPSNPADAKGLIKSALRGSDPVLFIEPKALFATKGEVPQGEHLVPFGVARLARMGSDVTIVASGRMVSLALEAALALAKGGVECEVIDLRSIVPLDLETILSSLRKTHHLLIVDEGYSMCGIGAELAAAVGELAFDELDAPVARLHLEPVSHPFSPKLEAEILPSPVRIISAVTALIAGVATPARRPRAPLCHRVESPAILPVADLLERVAKAPQPSGDGEPICMPHGDLTVSEAKVVKWLRETGDAVKTGEGVVEVETDKAVMEIESPADGIVQIVKHVGEVVKMGEVLGVVSPA